MFIDEDEAERRLRTEENLLNRISRPASDEKEIEIPPSPDFDLDEILNISDPLTTQIPESKKLEKTLKQALSFENGYAGRGTKNLHRDTQAGIGITAGILGTTKASRIGDVSIPSAHSYERGYTGPVDFSNPAKTPKQDLQERIIAGHGIIVDTCFNKLLKTLDLLDDEKLEKVQKATDLTLVAKNLSSIIGHAAAATQEQVEVQEKSVHFHIMKPEQAQENEYPTIEISSEKEEIAWKEKTLS